MIHIPQTSRRSFLKGIGAITASGMFPNYLRAQGANKKLADAEKRAAAAEKAAADAGNAIAGLEKDLKARRCTHVCGGPRRG